MKKFALSSKPSALSTSQASSHASLSSSSTPAKTIKLRLLAWDPESKAEICSYQNAPTLDLTLKLKKKWSDVVQYLLKKWGDVRDLQQRLQIFLLSPNQTKNPKVGFVEKQHSSSVDCLVDISISVGQTICGHPAFLLSSLAVPVIELYYHLKPFPPSIPTTTPSVSNFFISTDPTLDAFCEMGEFFNPPNRLPQFTSPTSVPRNGKRLSPEEDQASERSVRQRLGSEKQPDRNFQTRPLEIFNLPLFLNPNTPPPMAMSSSSSTPSDPTDHFNSSLVEDFPRDSDSMQLAFIRDGLQAIVDTPLSTLPPLDCTLDSSPSSFKLLPPPSSPASPPPHPNHQTYDPNLHLEMSPQFSSDTIAHLIDVMQDTETSNHTQHNSSPNRDEGKVTLTTVQPHSPRPTPSSSSLLHSIAASFKPPLETIPEKNSGSCYSPTSNFPSSSCESDSDRSNSAAKHLHAPFLPPYVRPSSPDQSSHLSLVESETIQDSDGDAHFHSQAPSHSNSHPHSQHSEEINSSVSHLSVGIPKAIMRANKRKPHLRRINPTLVGPLVSSPSSGKRSVGSWG
jgi:hypothetical protein